MPVSCDKSANLRMNCSITDGRACTTTVIPNPDIQIKGTGLNPSGGRNKKQEDVDIKYGLVPPFLGAASAVIIIYIIVHCLYLHCYAKKKMRSMAQHHNSVMQSASGHDALVMPDQPSTKSQPRPQIVTYEGAYGKSEVLSPKQFFIHPKQPHEESTLQNDVNQHVPCSNSNKPGNVGNTKGKRASSLLSSIKSYSSRKKKRQSTSSTGTDISGNVLIEQCDTLLQSQRKSPDYTMGPAVKTNVCFIPSGISDADLKADESSEWIPVQGYVYVPKVKNLENGRPNGTPNWLESNISQIVFIPMGRGESTEKTLNLPNTCKQVMDRAEVHDSLAGSSKGGLNGEGTQDDTEASKEQHQCLNDCSLEPIGQNEEFTCETGNTNITVEVHQCPVIEETSQSMDI